MLITMLRHARLIEDPPCGTEWHLTGWAKALTADTNTNTKGFAISLVAI